MNPFYTVPVFIDTV